MSSVVYINTANSLQSQVKAKLTGKEYDGMEQVLLQLLDLYQKIKVKSTFVSTSAILMIPHQPEVFFTVFIKSQFAGSDKITSHGEPGFTLKAIESYIKATNG